MRHHAGRGFEGERYDRSLTTMDIARKLREHVKRAHPGYKFSVRKDGAIAIRLSLVSGPAAPFADPAKTHAQINPYRVADAGLTPEVQRVMDDVVGYLQSYNRDDSDAQTDYFDTNFYLDIQIGAWDRPYAVTERGGDAA